jgi:hypothetical protein
MKSINSFLAASVLALFINSSLANADSRSRINFSANRIRQIDRLTDNLARSLKKLSPADLQQVLRKVSKLKLEDADDDGVPNLLEDDEPDVCDRDSDDDGIEDGDELEEGMDPSDEDSDDDGHEDQQEVEKEGEIQFLDSSSIQVSGVSFIVSEATDFFSKRKESRSIEDFAVGDCVEVEGHKDGDNNFADNIREEDCD